MASLDYPIYVLLLALICVSSGSQISNTLQHKNDFESDQILWPNLTPPAARPCPFGSEIERRSFPCTPGRPLTKCINVEPEPDEPMPVNLTLAFFGDQGLEGVGGSHSPIGLMVMLEQEENVEAIFHAGDFDYIDDPLAWDAQVHAALGPDFPYFSVIGNHDLPEWDHYKELIYARYENFGAKCIGDVGRDTICSYKGFTFIISGQGTSSTYGPSFVEALDDYPAIWRACIWHKNQRNMQLGDKRDEVGFSIYNECTQRGAFIITGHEHSYARSLPITHYANPRPTWIEQPTNQPIVLEPGVSWTGVIGTGGKPVRVCTQDKQNNPWWAAAYCSNVDPILQDAGALVCKFNLN